MEQRIGKYCRCNNNRQLSWLHQACKKSPLLSQIDAKANLLYVCVETTLVIHFMDHGEQRNCSYLLWFPHFVQHAMPPSPWQLYQPQPYLLYISKVGSNLNEKNKQNHKHQQLRTNQKSHVKMYINGKANGQCVINSLVQEKLQTFMKNKLNTKSFLY